MSSSLVFYYALRSPYAWLADRLIRDCLPMQARQAIKYVPYWDPRPQTLEALQARRASILFRPMSRERHFYILADVKHHARRLGYELRWPVDAAQPDWEAPHLACLHADRSGSRGADLRAALFAARWQQGLDICRPEVIEAVARDAGLALASADWETQDPAQHELALTALESSYRHRVFGVPYFVVGRECFWGVDRLPFALREAGLPWRALADTWLLEAA